MAGEQHVAEAAKSDHRLGRPSWYARSIVFAVVESVTMSPSHMYQVEISSVTPRE